MSDYTKLHIQAFLTNFEMGLEAGIFVTIIDFLWVLHDVVSNGISFWYVCIGSGLLMGIAWMFYILYRHHKYYVKKRIKNNMFNYVAKYKTDAIID